MSPPMPVTCEDGLCIPLGRCAGSTPCTGQPVGTPPGPLTLRRRSLPAFHPSGSLEGRNTPRGLTFAPSVGVSLPTRSFKPRGAYTTDILYCAQHTLIGVPRALVCEKTCLSYGTLGNILLTTCIAQA